MDKSYYEAIDTMEKAGVDPEYIQGWVGGYLQNPKREEQRITEAYDAGYSDGEDRNTENYANFKK
ncbi:MAG: hypothetical protein H6981_14060 [Gammaproteobacteria bacterium]|nr:hypothetical protein [Gammaproteobacteria bacterium]MCP5137908.1 hypothetical protein [Gammaproteobacteria bacterium]